MFKNILLGVSLFLVIGCGFSVSSVMAQDDEEGFVQIFNGTDIDGWEVHGGTAKYHVEDGAIVGVCDPDCKTNSFLCYPKEFGNFILKLQFKVVVPGNSGIQFRSHINAEDRVFGYQYEIDPSEKNDTGRIYDEGRRGFQFGRTWLDRCTPEQLAPAQAAFKADDWNDLEIQCMGPSIRTWINGVPVVNMFDYYDMSGIIGLQIHAGAQGTIQWKNIRIKDFGTSEWHPFFVEGKNGMELVAAYKFVPECWEFDQEGKFLKGTHTKTEQRDGLIVSDGDYANFAAKVTYQISDGNSALYFRAEEVNTPWLLKGMQNEIAGNGMEAGIWHTAGDKTPGRGWLGNDEDFVEQVRNKGFGTDQDWNTVCTCACGDHITTFLNGFSIVDIVDPECEKTGKLGLQLHGGADVQMWFKDFEVLIITPQMRELIER